MATARDVIRLGYREANFKTSSGDPTDSEFAEGLTILQSIQDSLFGVVTGIRLLPWYYPLPSRTGAFAANYPARPGDDNVALRDQIYPPSNARMILRNSELTRFYLQNQPEDGAVVEYVDAGHTGDVIIDANGSLFELAGSVEELEITGVFPAGRNKPRRWIHRADYGSWLEVKRLTLDSEMPFPVAFDEYFVTIMAIRLTPRFGAEPRQATVMRYRELDTFIRAQWAQSAPQVSGDLGVSTTQNWNWPASSADFDSGGTF